MVSLGDSCHGSLHHTHLQRGEADIEGDQAEELVQDFVAWVAGGEDQLECAEACT